MSEGAEWFVGGSPEEKVVSVDLRATMETGLVLLSGVVRFVRIVPSDDDDDTDSTTIGATAVDTPASSVLDVVVETSNADPHVKTETVSIADAGSAEQGLKSCCSGRSTYGDPGIYPAMKSRNCGLARQQCPPLWIEHVRLEATRGVCWPDNSFMSSGR